MFKYCLWYSLNPSHSFNACIRNNSKIFNTPMFPAHITIKHSLENEEVVTLYEQYKHANVPDFCPNGSPYMSTTYVDDRFFFAIEQPLMVNNVPLKNIHVSLAYKFDRPFTAMDIALVDTRILTSITPEDLKLCIVDCSSGDINDWSINTMA